jgi:hypothetical protein
MTTMIGGAMLLATMLASPAQPAQSSTLAPAQSTMATPAPVQGRPLTNGQVISLAKSGLPEDALIDIILASEPRFNLTSVGHALLAHAGVSPRVIRAMHKAGTSEPASIEAKGSVRPEDPARKPSGICVAVWCW